VVTAEQRGEILATLRRKAPVTAARLERQWQVKVGGGVRGGPPDQRRGRPLACRSDP
jgi:hypothetical protein